MTRNQPGGNALRRILTDPLLEANGICAELAGVRSIKVSKDGRFVGIWRQTVGSFDWYPAGYNQAQLRVPTPDQVARYMITALGNARSA
jgi:hypothetical protein